MQRIKNSVIVVTILMVLCCWNVSAYAEVGFGFRGGMLIPDQTPFKDEFDSNFIGGGVLELDSNLGVTLEASVEYYQQNSDNATLGGEISIVPVLFSVKYNFLPRYRTTPFIGIGAGTYFFDRDYKDGSNKTKTQFGVRLAGGFRLFEDRRMNIVLEGSRNFVDFRGENASSFQVTVGLIFDLNPSIIGAP